jgi:hypothetical protein
MRIWGAKIFGAIAGVFLIFLLAGLILPGTWEANSDRLLPAPPEAVYPFLAGAEQWVLWNPMPESGSEFIGPLEGAGSGLEWNDPQYGKGRFLVLFSEEDRRVEYEVEIEGGALTIHGTLTLSPEGSGSRLHWTEKGDFGWNPLLGWAAKNMADSQGDAMNASLDTLLTRLAATTASQGL